MPAPYGVTNAGFSTKTLAEQLVEIELSEQAVFGSGVVLDAQSPLGQINGLFADIIAELWEHAQGIYASFDVDQAEGVRLETIAKLRGITRIEGASDADLREAIKQSTFTTSSTQSLRSAVLGVVGVTSVEVVENKTDSTAPNGLPSHSLAVAVVGGDDNAVANAIYENAVQGVGLSGNTNVVLTIGEFARSVKFIRPSLIPVQIALSLFVNTSDNSRAPSSDEVIKSNIISVLTGDHGVGVGGTLRKSDVVLSVAGSTSINVVAVQLAKGDGVLRDVPLVFDIEEKMTIAPENITLTYVASDETNLEELAGIENVGRGTIA